MLYCTLAKRIVKFTIKPTPIGLWVLITTLYIHNLTSTQQPAAYSLIYSWIEIYILCSYTNSIPHTRVPGSHVHTYKRTAFPMQPFALYTSAEFDRVVQKCIRSIFVGIKNRSTFKNYSRASKRFYYTCSNSSYVLDRALLNFQVRYTQITKSTSYSKYLHYYTHGNASVLAILLQPCTVVDVTFGVVGWNDRVKVILVWCKNTRGATRCTHQITFNVSTICIMLRDVFAVNVWCIDLRIYIYEIYNMCSMREHCRAQLHKEYRECCFLTRGYRAVLKSEITDLTVRIRK